MSQQPPMYKPLTSDPPRSYMTLFMRADEARDQARILTSVSDIVSLFAPLNAEQSARAVQLLRHHVEVVQRFIQAFEQGE